MKITIDKSELDSILDVVITALPQNSTNPVLSGVKISASDNGDITVQATDLDNSCSLVGRANVSEEGSSVLPGKLLQSIVKTLENEPVTIETDDTKSHITCGKATFTTNVLDESEFPVFPEIESDAQVTIPLTGFQDTLKKLITSTAKNEAKGVFTGVFVDVHDGKIRAVSSDSFRVALTENTCEDNSQFSAVIPPKFLVKISTLKSSDNNVTLAYNNNQIIVKTGDVTFICRKLSGDYPNIEQFIVPKDDTVVVLDKVPLLTALKRVSVLKDENTPVTVEVDQATHTMRISVLNTNAGDAVEDLSVDCTGKDCKVGFDTGYLIDGLDGTNTEKVHVVITSDNTPTHIRPYSSENDNVSFDEIKETSDNMLSKNYLYLVMPVLIRQ